MVLLYYCIFYVFVFLAEKFRVVSIQSVNYVSISCALTGYLVFMALLFKAPRKWLNAGISGAILLLSTAMLVCSLILDRRTVDFLGLLSMCK